MRATASLPFSVDDDTRQALPARFLVACPSGHLDDFPWRSFVHRRAPICLNGQLALKKIGQSDEAADLLVTCSCGAKRSMAEAFGDQRAGLGPCCRTHPHLREAKGCEETMEPILLGASNSWFPVTLSALSLPSEQGDEIARLANWCRRFSRTATHDVSANTSRLASAPRTTRRCRTGSSRSCRRASRRSSSRLRHRQPTRRSSASGRRAARP